MEVTTLVFFTIFISWISCILQGFDLSPTFQNRTHVRLLNKPPMYCDGDPGVYIWTGGKSFSLVGSPTRGMTCGGSSSPGSRSDQAYLTLGNTLYTFGGYNHDGVVVNQVWSLDLSNDDLIWTYLSGDTNNSVHSVDFYSTFSRFTTNGGFVSAGKEEGTTSSNPGALVGSVAFQGMTDQTFLIFGGYGYKPQGVWNESFTRTSFPVANNRIWEYNISFSAWTWWTGIAPYYEWDGTENMNSYVFTFQNGYNEGDKFNFPEAGGQPGVRAYPAVYRPLTDVDPNLVFIFGGKLSNSRCYNDFWKLDLEKLGDSNYDNEISGEWSKSWTKLYPSSGTPLTCQTANIVDKDNYHPNNRPAPRSGMYYWQYKLSIDLRERFFFFGGVNDCTGEYLNDVWTFDYQLTSFFPLYLSYNDQYTNQKSNYAAAGSFYNDVYQSLEYINIPGGRGYGGVYLFKEDGNPFDTYFALLMGGKGYEDSSLVGDIGFTENWMFNHVTKSFAYFSGSAMERKVNQDVVIVSSGLLLLPHSSRSSIYVQHYNDITTSQLIIGGHSETKGRLMDVWNFTYENECRSSPPYKSGSCNHAGLCTFFGSRYCTCDNYHAGQWCGNTKLTCYKIPANDSLVCNNGTATCVSHDSCSCPKSGYYYMWDDNCNITTCNSQFSNTTDGCNNHGLCVGYDKCDCDGLFDGKFCDIPVVVGGSGLCHHHWMVITLVIFHLFYVFRGIVM